jgi:AcrR family transcriptional regulator
MASKRSSRPWARTAEARRNRETLLGVAARAFATNEGRVTLESIARDAGVGIGTLYRHFPTRDALVEAVYRDQMERLGEGARELLEHEPPAVALRQWMSLFADWAATKHGMIDALRSMIAAGNLDVDGTHAHLNSTLQTFLDAGAKAGDLRDHVDAADILAMLAGILSVATPPDRRAQTDRLLDLVVAGLSPTSRDTSSAPTR